MRGQTIVSSAGNGIENAFVVPNSPDVHVRSHQGPDWMITVGATTPPEDGHYDAFFDEDTEEKPGGISGAGKPVDVASLGYDYPTAYYAESVGETGSIGFSGTSNAAPTISGTYARSLYLARKLLLGTSRTQDKGVIARGWPVRCGTRAARRASCATAS